MNRKEKYESPWMERTLVELEDGFCAGSATITNKGNAAIEAHKVNADFSGDFSGGGWTDEPTPEQF